MVEELKKFKRNIKGSYLYLFISGLFWVVGLIILNIIYPYNPYIIPLDKFSSIVILFSSWIAIFLGGMISLLSYLGYRSLNKNMDYESFYDLRYKFTICILMLGFIQFLFLDDFIVLLVVFYILNLFILYEMFFSKTIVAINYYNDLENSKK